MTAPRIIPSAVLGGRRGPEGPDGPQGPPGYNAVGAEASQEAVADWVAETAGPNALSTALAVSFDAKITNAAAKGSLAVAKPSRYGVVLELGGIGDPDELRVEGLNVSYDAAYGKHLGVYVGYAGSPEVATVCWATSDDGVNWTKHGALLEASGSAGAPDEGGVTGPVMHVRHGVRYLFHIGLTATGYEGGDKTLCVATRPAGEALDTGGWTRHGTILDHSDTAVGDSAWRKDAIWHPSIVDHRGLTYCFINATGPTGETIGYATNGGDLTDPADWVWDDANSPVFDQVGDSDITGDPSIIKIDGGYLCALYRGGPTVSARDYYYTTTDDEFPFGWTIALGGVAATEPGPAGAYDEVYAHKPALYAIKNRLHHYTTVVMSGDTNRRVALLTWPPLPNTGETRKTSTPVNIGRFSQVQTSGTGVDTALTTTFAKPTNFPTAKVQANAGDLLELILAYFLNDGDADVFADAVTLAANGTTITNYAANTGSGGKGVSGWSRIGAPGVYTDKGGPPYHYRVQTVDVIDGVVSIVPVLRRDASARVVLNSGANLVTFAVRNLS